MDKRISELVKDIIDKSEKSNVCICGDNGSGKITMLKEICKLLDNAIYVDSEDLVNEIDILGSVVLYEKYANYDFFIIDNISILLPRKNLFNTIQDLNIQKIYSSPIKLKIPNTYNLQI